MKTRNQAEREYLNLAATRLEYRAMYHALEELSDLVSIRQNQLHNVVNSTESQNILEHTTGSKWLRIYDLKCRLRAKIEVLWDVQGHIYELQQKYRNEYLHSISED